MSDKPHSPYLVAISQETRATRKHHAPAAARNTAPILDVLRGVLPEMGRALEIASGTGQHIAAFAEAFPGIDWQPSDPDAAARDSIAAWVAESGRGNLAPPLPLDVTVADWERAIESGIDAILCINMIHISPWAAGAGLLRGSGRLLRPGGLLYLYGPYKRGGRHTAPSNAAFDWSLRQRNPDWGVRDVDDVLEAAASLGFDPAGVVAMPVNNLSVLLRRR